jgi:Ala-tRNA(Pro) deacylase
MTMTSMATTGVVRALADAGVEHEVLPHAHTETARAEAEAVGVSPCEVAKTIVLTTPDGYARAVIPASERLDMQRIRHLLGGRKETRLTTEPELVAAYPEFELGAVPPFGGPAGDRVLVDRKLAECECVVFDGGSHEESIRMRTDDLLQLADAELRDIVMH